MLSDTQGLSDIKILSSINVAAVVFGLSKDKWYCTSSDLKKLII